MMQTSMSESMTPLQRFQIREGTLLDGTKWELAHDYHHQRQSLLYNALYQPGIVCGLGVKIEQNQDEFNQRQLYWLEVQPGVALDKHGNCIVVSQAQSIPIPTITVENNPITIYLLIRFREKKVPQSEPSVITESYDLEIRQHPPTELDVEICRIRLENAIIKVSLAEDVSFPQAQELDFTHRIMARSRSDAIVQLGMYHENNTSSQIKSNLKSLLASFPSLYPHWQGKEDILNVPCHLVTGENFEYYYFPQLINCDLFYLTELQWQTILKQANYAAVLTLFKNYLEAGGVLLVEGDSQSLSYENLAQFAERVNSPLESLNDLPNHRLWSEPFLFQCLPSIQGQEIKIWIGGGIIYIAGNLSSAWGANSSLLLPADTIRTAQEMGLNILHLATYRRYLTQLQL